MKSIHQVNKLFLAAVVVPTLIAGIYYGLIASDVYISESRFVVRSPDQQTVSSLGSILQGVGFSRSQDDSYTVQDFMLSRDALRVLDQQLNIRRTFGEGDVFSRFPPFYDWDDSFENLHHFYQKKVGVQIDSVSSIATVTVRAFSAEDAYRINEMLIEMSETLVNQLNERGRQDMIKFSSSEVTEAEKKAKLAALTLASYRNEMGVIDPERQSAIPLQQIAKLQDEIIATKTQLAQLQMLTKDNPQIPVLKNRIQTLETEIEIETSRVTGGDRSLASKVVDYQRLALDKKFADKQLTTALASLEQARIEALRKQLYLERIAQPSKPDAAMEPRRLRALLAVIVLGLVAWGVLSMLITGIREHQD